MAQINIWKNSNSLRLLIVASATVAYACRWGKLPSSARILHWHKLGCSNNWLSPHCLLFASSWTWRRPAQDNLGSILYKNKGDRFIKTRNDIVRKNLQRSIQDTNVWSRTKNLFRSYVSDLWQNILALIMTEHQIIVVREESVHYHGNGWPCT